MEDEKIIDLYFERNESAVAETALKYGRMLRAIAYGILKNHQDSEECENDTYHVAWNKIPPERPSYFWDVSCEMSRLANMTIIMLPSVIRILR